MVKKSKIVTVNNTELEYPWNIIVGIPVMIAVCAFIGLMFLSIAAIFLAPFAFLIWVLITAFAK